MESSKAPVSKSFKASFWTSPPVSGDAASGAPVSESWLSEIRRVLRCPSCRARARQESNVSSVRAQIDHVRA
jgi:hypothetical protein